MYIYLCSRSRASVVDELRELDIESYLYHFLTSDTPQFLAQIARLVS